MARVATKTELEKHTIVCHQQSVIMPSQHVLLQCILELSKKCDRLETKLQNLHLAEYRAKRRTVEEYLKMLPIPNAAFHDWIRQIELTRTDLEFIFEHTMKDGITNVLETRLEKTTGTPPIQCFYERPNTIYVYDETAQEPATATTATPSIVGTWRSLKAEEFRKIVLQWMQRLMKLYLEWKEQNAMMIERNEQMGQMALVYMQKINGGNLESHLRLIKKTLYDNIKQKLSKL
jgi:hypothetical protein